MKEHHWISSRGQRLSAISETGESWRPGRPTIVLCHGFTADKVGANHLTKNLAGFIARLGYGTLRFDYIGSGESDGSFAAHTRVSGWREDLANVLNWLAEQPRLGEGPIVLYGHSLGGLIVLNHPAADERIVGRIVFAPVSRARESFRRVILGEELWQAACKGQTIKNFYQRAFTLDPQFVQDLENCSYDPGRNLAKLTAPLLLVHGTADDVIPAEHTQSLYEAYTGEKQLQVTGFDHVASGHHQELQQLIGSWLAERF